MVDDIKIHCQREGVDVINFVGDIFDCDSSDCDNSDFDWSD